MLEGLSDDRDERDKLSVTISYSFERIADINEYQFCGLKRKAQRTFYQFSSEPFAIIFVCILLG